MIIASLADHTTWQKIYPSVTPRFMQTSRLSQIFSDYDSRGLCKTQRAVFFFFSFVVVAVFVCLFLMEAQTQLLNLRKDCL